MLLSRLVVGIVRSLLSYLGFLSCVRSERSARKGVDGADTRIDFMTYTIIPFIVFGTMSTALYAVCGVVDLFRWGWNSIRKSFQKEVKVKRAD
jgi:hypothetical protein